MHDMFAESTGLIELDLSNWDTSIVQNMHNMFYKCENLTKIYTSDKFKVNQVTSSDKMFQGATNLS
jgi:surface protein